jgi:hypothetical protein
MTVTRRAHRLLGLMLLLPICAWALTGFVFFVKPGYEAAYGELRVPLYPLEGGSAVPVQPGWIEARAVRTILGTSVLARTDAGWMQVDPVTREPRALPDESGLRQLVDDAIAKDRSRYGNIAKVVREEGASPAASFETTTGVRIELDWSRLTLQQSGRDTRLIDGLYHIHYLQWTGVRAIDRVVGVVGLVALLVLAIVGLRLAFAGNPARPAV